LEKTLEHNLEVIKEVLITLEESPHITKSISTTKNGTKISAYRCGGNIVRIDINTKDVLTVHS
jgi:hypothetical protein